MEKTRTIFLLVGQTLISEWEIFFFFFCQKKMNSVKKLTTCMHAMFRWWHSGKTRFWLFQKISPGIQRCGPTVQLCCACSIYWFQNNIWKNSFRGGTFVMCLTVVVVVVVSSLNSFRLYVMRVCVCVSNGSNKTEQNKPTANNKQKTKKWCEMWIPLSLSHSRCSMLSIKQNKNKSTTTPKCVQPATTTTKSNQCFSFHLISSNVFKKKID